MASSLSQQRYHRARIRHSLQSNSPNESLEGKCKWYLGVAYDRDLQTVAVNANQESYINKSLTKYCLKIEALFPTPFPSKADAVTKQLELPSKSPSPDLRIGAVCKRYTCGEGTEWEPLGCHEFH